MAAVAVAELDARRRRPTTTSSDGRTSQSTTRDGSTAPATAGGRRNRVQAAQSEVETDAPNSVCSSITGLFVSIALAPADRPSCMTREICSRYAAIVGSVRVRRRNSRCSLRRFGRRRVHVRFRVAARWICDESVLEKKESESLVVRFYRGRGKKPPPKADANREMSACPPPKVRVSPSRGHKSTYAHGRPSQADRLRRDSITRSSGKKPMYRLLVCRSLFATLKCYISRRLRDIATRIQGQEAS